MRRLPYFLLWLTLAPLWAQQLELPNSQGGCVLLSSVTVVPGEKPSMKLPAKLWLTGRHFPLDSC